MTVDTGNDTTHSTNDCATGAGTSCSLRDAITQANTNGGGAIIFKSPGQSVILFSQLPAITANNVTVTGLTTGSGATLTEQVVVFGLGNIGIFAVNSGVTGAAIANLRISVGAGGSAISNQGALTVINCEMFGISLVNPGGTAPPPASAVSAITNASTGTLTITGSVFAGNAAYLGGGAIENNGTLTVISSTFSGNSATSPTAGTGGAIANTGTLTIADSTFSGNSAVDIGGAIYSNSGTASVVNSIFSGNSASAGNGGAINDAGGGVTDSYNVFYNNTGGDAAGFTLSPTDVTGKDPKLAPLGWYGGPTQTTILLPGSAAVCAASAGNLPSGVTTDQRGYGLDPTCASGKIDAGAVQSNQFVVNTLADQADGTTCTGGAACSLRDALTLGNTTAGDITFASGLSGTITLSSALPAVTGVLNLMGPGSQTLTVSGGDSATVGSIFTVNNGLFASFFGLTFANGNATVGGAINGGYGVTVSNCAFVGNSATGNGGAIYGANTLTVSNCTFSANSATNGTALTEGGAIVADNLAVSNSTFSGNSATWGGAIYSPDGGTINNSTFSNNSAGLGGAIYNSASLADVTLTVSDSTFSNNSATASGGAIYDIGGTLPVSNSTFSANSATTAGGAISLNSHGNTDPGALTVANTIVSGNSSASGGGIINSGGSVTDSYNVYYNNTGGDADGYTLSSTDQTGSTANPYLSSLGWYGGPTQTMIPLPGSAALCNGQYQSGERTTDQRGAPDATCPNSGGIDIGAVQISGNPPLVVAVTPNSGTAAGGTSVVITGTGLDSPAAVSFGQTAAASYSVTAASGTTPASITAVSPSGSAGTVDVTVANSSGTSTTSLADEFTYISNPAATPTFSPAAGTYNSVQSVTIADSTAGVDIYYTTDGSTPTMASTRYMMPITVSLSETVNAIAVGSAYTSSAVGSASYTINLPAAATPTFSLGTGTYASVQSVTISDSTTGATIYYTTDGSTPSSASTQYTGAITVNSSETINAIALARGYTNSAVGSASYTINLPTAATPTFSPGAGTYASAQSVTISDSTTGATIYYTADGSTPTTASTQYTTPVMVNSSETVKAIAMAGGYTSSAVASANYTFTPGFTAGSGGSTTLSIAPGAITANTATVSVAGTFGFSGSVSLSCSVTTTMTTVTDAPTCSLNPTSVLISGATAQTSTLTVNTTAASSAKDEIKGLLWPSAGGATLAFLLFFTAPKRRRGWLALLGALVMVASISAVGCGGGGGGGGGSSGTTAGSYTITVMGTSGTTSATVGTIALTVQ